MSKDSTFATPVPVLLLPKKRGFDVDYLKVTVHLYYSRVLKKEKSSFIVILLVGFSSSYYYIVQTSTRYVHNWSKDLSPHKGILKYRSVPSEFPLNRCSTCHFIFPSGCLTLNSYTLTYGAGSGRRPDLVECFTVPFFYETVDVSYHILSQHVIMLITLLMNY